jgi:acetylornithine/succinyldiaminopimelate/putrescine aminotransferase
MDARSVLSGENRSPPTLSLSCAAAETHLCSMSTDPESRNGFGPYLEGVGPNFRDGDAIRTIRYGEIEDIKRALELHGKDVAAVLLEPIQGEAGIVVPPIGYFGQVRELCTQHNVLLICDEIQTVRDFQVIMTMLNL